MRYNHSFWNDNVPKGYKLMPLIKQAEPIIVPTVSKKKILFLSDHPLAPSGVGVQARMLIEGLLQTGKYTFRCLGGAVKHPDYSNIVVNSDFVIKPVDGFGTRGQIRNILMTERPDAVIIFTDPRQFIWLWEIEDEIHQVCPIAYWHVWDNDPYPVVNSVWYESTDLINCLSYKTYEMVAPRYPEKTNYIPHAFPKNMYFPGPEDLIAKGRKQNFGDKSDWFIALWVNRNATRKMPADIMESWKMFLDKLEKQHGHRKACLVMHTDPTDQEGPNLFAVQELLGLQGNVLFSIQKLDFQQMNVLHNCVDVCLNISKAEGFGLSTLISMQVGKPILALKTGGLTRQVVDHRDGTEMGVAISPVARKLVGSQMVPYIYEDYASQEDVANGLLKLFNMSSDEKRILKEKLIDYTNTEFNYEKMITDWDNSLQSMMNNWEANKSNKKDWELISLDDSLTVTTPKKQINNPLKKIHPNVLHRLTAIGAKQ